VLHENASIGYRVIQYSSSPTGEEVWEVRKLPHPLHPFSCRRRGLIGAKHFSF